MPLNPWAASPFLSLLCSSAGGSRMANNYRKQKSLNLVLVGGTSSGASRCAWWGAAVSSNLSTSHDLVRQPLRCTMASLQAGAHSLSACNEAIACRCARHQNLCLQQGCAWWGAAVSLQAIAMASLRLSACNEAIACSRVSFGCGAL